MRNSLTISMAISEKDFLKKIDEFSEEQLDRVVQETKKVWGHEVEKIILGELMHRKMNYPTGWENKK